MKEESTLKRILNEIIDLIKSFALIFIIIFVLFKVIIMPCSVNGSSMEPTLQNGQLGFSIRITKYFEINRFDICILEIKDEEEDKFIVKRVIGLPNETIEYKDNKLYVDGVYYEEDFLGDVITNDFSVTLGDDEYYCLGDNRNISRDSRSYGAFNSDNFKATNFFVFYPFNEAGLK